MAVGPNGAGKTNLLEALHVGTQGFSPRTRVDANLIRFGQTLARVAVGGALERGDATLEVRLQPSGKEVRLNDTVLPSLERLRAEVATLVFTPDRLALVKAGPAARRMYLDRTLARLFPARAPLPSEYAAALTQRNAALRRVAAGLSSADVVRPWNERVGTIGRELTAARALVVETLTDGFRERAGELGLDAARIEYAPSAVSSELLEELIARDLERGTTGAGPHLDEVRIFAAARDLRSHGSQGEQRVAVLALLLAEADLLRESRRVPPLLLLDDVLSELDGERRLALVSRIGAAGQVLVTATARGALPREAAQVLEIGLGFARAA